MFKFIKKEEKKETCCDGNCCKETIEKAELRKAEGGIKVLGGGCKKCHELKDNTEAALSELGLDENVELITDFSIIATYGVISTPALVVDNKVVGYGKVLKEAEVIEAIKTARGLE